MSTNKKQIFFLILAVSIMSCNVNLNPKENRIFVVEEKRIDDNNIFFWFKGTGQITHGSLSYFQIAKYKCDLSFKKVNAYCNEPIQIFDIKEDTVFLLTQSEIINIKAHERFKIKSVAYSIELYEVGKRSNREKQYFLDSVCK